MMLAFYLPCYNWVMKVVDIMTTDVKNIGMEASVVEAANTMFEHNFEGLPVTDEHGTLVGLVTQANLVSTTHLHLPTLLSLIKKFDIYRKDKKFLQAEIERVSTIKVRDVMNQEPPILYEGESIDRTLMHLSATHGVSPTSVVTMSRKLIGVVTRRDVLKLYGTTSSPAITPVNSQKIVNEYIEGFLDGLHKYYFLISRWRTKAWLTTNIVFLIIGVIVAALFMLRITIR